ncbi:hypothetical protein HYV11_00855 [Candidatus Dependentiae bacterium]|nr:hypothetical protein [Candidatus Dependentiae bacterium]
MYKKFITAIKWNFINTFFYKIILLIHQIILFYFISKELYGEVGTMFALLYLLINGTGYGFEYILFVRYSNYVKSKQAFLKIIFQFFLKLLSIFITIAIFMIMIHFYRQNDMIPIPFLNYQLPTSTIPFFLLLFFIENSKKYLENIAQLAFLNKAITFIQIGSLLLYISTVWSSFFILKKITLSTFFIPLIISGILELFYIIVIIYRFYLTLPNNQNELKLSQKSIFKEQLSNYINQLSKNIFSPNFLLILIASYISMQQVGIIRFYTNIITLFYLFLNKSIAIPSSAFFANINEQAFEKTKKLFLKITNNYVQLLYFIAIIIMSTVLYHMLQKQCSIELILITIFFIFATFIEYVTIMYEKLFILRQMAYSLMIINTISAILFIITLVQLHPQPFILLAPVCVIRISAAYCIGLIAYRKWNIKPQKGIRAKTLLSGIFSALIINIFIKLHCLFL